MITFVRRFYIILPIVLFITGCHNLVGYDINMLNGKPRWYWQPSVDGKIGGVGEAGTHINGSSAQRQLAVQRALEDIARQKGVNVNSVMGSYNKYSSSESNISGGVKNFYSTSASNDTFSIHTVDGVFITATVKEYWTDPDTGRLIVWMVEEK